MTNETRALNELRAELRQKECAIIDAPDCHAKARMVENYIDWANEQMLGWEENGAGEEALADFIIWAEEQI